jgi:two-component system phosphate regulon sensor histidine kinase PhoR
LKNQYKAEIHLFLMVLVFSFLVGLAIGYPLSTLLLGVIGYIGWIFYQVRKLDRWLAKSGRGENPQLTGIYAYIIDRIVRLQKQQGHETQLLRDALDRQNLLISKVKDGVVLVDNKDRIKWFNKSAEHLIHLNPKRDLAVPIRGALRHASFHAYYDSQDYVNPKRICFDEAKKSWLDISVTQYEDDEKLLVIRDASMLQELEDMRRDFIANLSHELRTPVTVLVGYLETLGLQDGKDPAVAIIHSEMNKQCSRISALLKDLLTLSRLEAIDTKPSDSKIDISRLLEQIAADAPKLEEFDKHKIKLNIAPDLRVIGAESDMISAFSNLIYNAIRHTPAGTEIIIKAKSKQRMARVEVIDKGYGIERQHLDRLTERFYRAESSRNSESGGTGLGLAIVKHALMRSGGKLKVESTLGKGSSFRCLLPLAPKKETQEET